MGAPIKRIPTGVADFDSIINGGFPAGSVVLLLGELGAGQVEFSLTSAAKLALVKDHPESMDYFLGRSLKNRKLPEKLCYVTFARSEEDILQEISISFNDEFYEAFKNNVIFKDFSASYFKHTLVPSSWTGEMSLFGTKAEDNVLEGLVEFLDENAPESLIIIDSITDLVVNAKIEINDLISVLRGMQRMAKRWGGVIYLILAVDILEKKLQKMIMDSVDGSLVFEWSKFQQSSKRQRYLYVEKFMSILPHLDKERIARFATVVTSQSGLVVIDTERIG
ncbi:MAG: recombinase RecA [Methanomassiliicoccales archaeon]|nr:recombinase RecA [Methanomassiliicoccales archaeon]NYT15429.1 recombinase RecA [Methanomassiliicoccales archaeon]